VSIGYFYGVYSPTQDRVYLAPYNQTTSNTWHYIKCDDATVVSYEHGLTYHGGYYFGGCYAPSQNRIYFSPTKTSDNTWHYINCDDGSVVEYEHKVPHSRPLNLYQNAVYLPTLDRVYFIPRALPTKAKTYEYYDCHLDKVVSYTHTLALDPNADGYQGGTYCPILNKIFLTPHNQASAAGKNWHYIDGETGKFEEYIHTLSVLPPANATQGNGTYCPINNRLYLPQFINSLTWYYIQDLSEVGNVVNSEILASSYMNNG
jgi:hypothetical protein